MQIHQAARPSAHIPSLDGIRGTAILLVMIHHFVGAHEKSDWFARKLIGFAEAGWCGVDLFFCLSGFLITGILIDFKNIKRPLWTFYMRRTLRIFPLYYFTLFMLFIVIPAFVPLSPEYINYKSYQWWHWVYLPNVLILFKLPYATLATSHFWSLAVEEQFYMFWPFVVLFTRLEALKRWCLILFGMAFLFRVTCFALDWGHTPAYVLPIARLDSLVAGAFIAIIVRDANWLARYAGVVKPVFFIAISVFAGIVLFQGSFRRSPAMMTLGFSSLALVFAIGIGAAAINAFPAINRIFECRFLRFFGKYSYAMYVFHTFIIVGLLSVFPSPHDSGSIFAGGVPRIVLFTVTGILASSIAGVASWVLIEKHALKLKKYFEPRID
jgi:peptidoglycan/LPS O-acetylase OafA/YrhL